MASANLAAFSVQAPRFQPDRWEKRLSRLQNRLWKTETYREVQGQLSHWIGDRASGEDLDSVLGSLSRQAMILAIQYVFRGMQQSSRRKDQSSSDAAEPAASMFQPNLPHPRAVDPLTARNPQSDSRLDLVLDAELVDIDPASDPTCDIAMAPAPLSPSSSTLATTLAAAFALEADLETGADSPTPAPFTKLTSLRLGSASPNLPPLPPQRPAQLAPQREAPLDTRLQAHQQDQEDAEIRAMVFSMASPARSSSTPLLPSNRKARKIQEEVAAAEEAWSRALGEMMAKLKADRLRQGISYLQLHHKTQIPIYQLQLLEAMAIDRLPEPIYVNGFVRRVADALGHNGQELVKTLPNHNPHPENVVPEWYLKHQAVENKVQVQPVHLYVGYAALMAGALGGLQGIMQPAPAPMPALMNQSVPDSAPSYEVVQTLPTASWEQSEALSRASMAPPERLSSGPELSP